MRSLTRLFVTVIAHLAAAQFINPPSSSGQTAGDYSADAVYKLGSSINITWFTSCPTVGLGLWQDGVNHVQSISSSVANTGFYNWEPINTTFNLANGHAFFFELYNNTGGSVSILFGSHYFNLTDGSSATTTKSSSTSTSASTSSSTSTTTSNSAAVASTVTATLTPSSSPTSPPPTATSSAGLSTSAKAGIGAGIGVGVPVLAALAVGLFLLGKRNRKAHEHAPAYGGQGVDYQQKPPLGNQYQYSQAPIHELPQNTQRESQPLPHPTYELPNNAR